MCLRGDKNFKQNVLHVKHDSIKDQSYVRGLDTAMTHGKTFLMRHHIMHKHMSTNTHKMYECYAPLVMKRTNNIKTKNYNNMKDMKINLVNEGDEDHQPTKKKTMKVNHEGEITQKPSSKHE